MQKVIRRVGVLSVGKIAGVLYAAIGLVAGCVFAAISMIGGFAALAQQEAGAGFISLFFGMGAIIFVPLFYGTIGALMAMLMAALYNLAAGMIGGIEFEVD